MTLSFGLILLSVLFFGLLHSLLASQKVKARIWQWFGPTKPRWYRLAFDTVAIVTFLPTLILLFVLPDKSICTIHYPWLILTTLVQLIAVAVLLIGLRQTGLSSFLGIRQWLYPEDTPQHSILVTDGLYRYVRHPLYTAGLVFVWLSPFLS